MPRRPASLPPELGASFNVAAAATLGMSRGRLQLGDLITPYRGVRMRRVDSAPDAVFDSQDHGYARQREFDRVTAYAHRGIPGQFFTHRSAALIWGVPLPHLSHLPHLPHCPVQVGVLAPTRAPRVRGVIGHTLDPSRCDVIERNGLPVTSAAITWAMLGTYELADLVAIGDHLVRVHREGYGRWRTACQTPLTTRPKLAELLAIGRWPGQSRLSRALPLIREDSWSPAESQLRLALVLNGLPEPALNGDVFSDDGQFLGCLDVLYRKYRVGLEYQGQLHASTYARDVERIERLRRAGWHMLQVTATVLHRPDVIADRVRAALHARGWQPGLPVA